MDERELLDCPGTDAPVAETPVASCQPGQSAIDELLEHNDEWKNAEQLLWLYDADDTLEFRFLHPTRTVRYRGVERRLSVSIYRRVGDILNQPQKFVRLLLEKMIGGYNCYFSVHPRYPITGNRASTTNDVKTIRALALDFDNVTPECVPELLREHQLPTPTLTANSGYGVHLYWFLDQPVTRLGGADLFRQFVTLHSRREKLRADPACKDVARILRLPGTINQQKGNRPPALCQIIEVEPERRYHPADLLPESKEVESVLQQEEVNQQRQDQSWQERQANRAETIASRKKDSSRPPSSISLPPYIHISHSLSENSVHRGEWDSDYLLSLLDQHPVEKPGERHWAGFSLLVDLKRSVGRVGIDQLRYLHARWFRRFKENMSGQTGLDESWADFLNVWQWLWRTDAPERTQDFLRGEVLVQHPGRNLLPAGRRYNRHRQLADLIFTASRNVGFAPDSFFLSIRDIQKRLGLENIESAWRVLRLLKRTGLVIQTAPAVVAKRRATYYSIPEQFRR